jgi:hypothetical protein
MRPEPSRARDELQARRDALRDQRLEVRRHRRRIAGVVPQADVAVRTHSQHRHADDSELSGHRFIDPAHLRAARARASVARSGSARCSPPTPGLRADVTRRPRRALALERRVKANAAGARTRPERSAWLAHPAIRGRFTPAAAVLAGTSAGPQPQPPPQAVRGPAEIQPATADREVRDHVAAGIAPHCQAARDDQARDGGTRDG